jgi:hypothetical protein
MRTTTTIWPNQAINLSTFPELENKLHEILGGDVDEFNSLTDVSNNDDGTKTVVRSWPNLAAAEAWVASCNVVDPAPVSIVVDPE